MAYRRGWLCAVWMCLFMVVPLESAWAQLTIKTSGDAGYNSPPALTGLRTVDFGTLTLANEVAASRVSTAGTSLTFPASGQPTTFSGAYAELDSGTGSARTSTINFRGNGTNYVGFLWAVAVNNPDTLKVTFTHSNGTSLTVSNCQSFSTGCVGGYVPGSWLTQLISGLFGLVFGSGAPNYGTVYMNYVPPAGQTVTKVDFYAKDYTNCFLIFICSDKSQYVWVDNLSYTDTVQLHHMEVTAPSASVASGTNLTYTIKACANADCSTLYTAGVAGTLTFGGTGMMGAYPGGSTFTVPLGSSSTTLVASVSPGGTAIVGLGALSVTPAGSPPVYCGLGVAATSSTTCNLTVTQLLHHLEISSNVSPAVTCSPVTYTVKACADTNCTMAYTAGLTGTIRLTGSGVTINPAAGIAFTISPGSSSVDASFNVTTPGTVAAALSGLSQSAANSLVCGTNTTTGSNACNVTVGNSALYLVVPNHVSDAVSSLTAKAVQASTTNSSVCVPAFTTAKAVTLKCAYANPTTGTLPVRVGAGVSLNSANSSAAACDGTGRSVSLSFDATGTASVALQYADVGQMTVTGTYTGTGSEAGLNMSGSASFIAIPASVSVSGVPAGVTKAGTDIAPLVTVKNSSGAATPNFGRESTPASITLAIAKTKPTGTGAVFGTLKLTNAGVSTDLTSGTTQTLAFTNGVSNTLTARWSEVGAMTFTATLVGGAYLGVADALTSVGTLTSIPDQFGVTVTPAAGCSFFFNGQPMKLTVEARNLQGATTLNYDGSAFTTPNQAYATSVALNGTPSTPGTLSISSLAGSAFSKGVAVVDTTASPPLSYSFSSKLGAPTTIGLKVTETGGNGVSNNTVPSIALRSGRLKMFNKFGSEKQTMEVSVQSQYWTGKAWVVNALDSCTSIPTAAISLSGYRDNRGAATSAWTTGPLGPLVFSQGKASVRFSAPNPAATGSVDVALNLGAASTSADVSCLITRATTTGAGSPWLRAQNGSCAATYDRDPSARLTFGVYSPESTKTIYGRELY